MKYFFLFFLFFLVGSLEAQTMSLQYELPSLKRNGKAPLEFKFNFQKGKYICQREDLWQKNPNGNQTSAPSLLAQANAVCSRNGQLIVRLKGQLFGLHGFSNNQKCTIASQQFSQTQGCYCTANHQMVCLDASFRPQQLGRGFHYSAQCEKAIKNLTAKFAVRGRRLKN